MCYNMRNYLIGGVVMYLTNLDYNLLFTFKTCVEEKSFSKAANVLHVKQPAISYSINKLEELLGITLFERTRNGLIMTDEAKILYEYVISANNSIASGLGVLEEMKKVEIPEIKVGVSLNIAVTFIAETIKEFNKLFPNVKISIVSRDEQEMLEELQKKELDVVFFNSFENNNIPNIKIKKIKNNEIVCVGVKKYYDILSRDNINKKIEIPIITPSKSTHLGKKLNTKLSYEKISFKISTCCHSSIIAKELIMSGLGIGYINKEIVKNELEEEKLFIIDDNSNIDTYSIEYAIKDKNVNFVIKEFIKIFKKKVVDE